MSARTEILTMEVNQGRDWLKKGLRSRSIRFAAIVLTVFVAVIIAPAFLKDPFAQDVLNRLQPPSGEHWFGTDPLGRDVFARVIHAVRVSLTVGAVSSVCALVLGGAYGAISGAFGGRVDNVMMRLLEVVLAFPGTMLAIVLAIALGPGFQTVIIAIAFVFAAPIARLVRGLVIDELKQDYVIAAVLIGSSRFRILVRHVLVNMAAPVFVYMMIIAAEAIMVEAGLSFLGAGLVPPTPSLGAMILEGQQYLLVGKWWLAIFSGVLIAAIVLTLNTLADVITREMREGGGR